ncbi:cellulose biosynthesis protein BcsN [Rhizobium sp. PP-F2F-G20b]|nr:cellulose biosynthesis protein BcsN [Rhizobium sp. PP-F2F-G20b]
MQGAFLALGASALSGCTQTGGLKMTSAPTEVAAEKALAFPAPGGPAIVSVIERNFSNAVQQDIILSTDARSRGQNYIQVRYFGPASTPFAGGSRLSTGLMTTAQAVGEMRSEFPTIRMSISPSFVQNNYGAFAYAYGTNPGSGDACLYGWQQIKAPDNYVRTFHYLGRIQTRVRFCQTGASRDELLSMMYHYTLTGAFDSVGWNPYGNVPPLDPTVGQLGRPIYAAGAGARLQPPTPAPVAAPAAPVGPAIRSLESQNTRPAAPRIETVRPIVPAVAIPAPDMVTRSPLARTGQPTGADIQPQTLPGPSRLPGPTTTPATAPATGSQTPQAPRPTSQLQQQGLTRVSSASPLQAQPIIPAVPCTISPTSSCAGEM